MRIPSSLGTAAQAGEDRWFLWQTELQAGEMVARAVEHDRGHAQQLSLRLLTQPLPKSLLTWIVRQGALPPAQGGFPCYGAGPRG